MVTRVRGRLHDGRPDDFGARLVFREQRGRRHLELEPAVVVGIPTDLVDRVHRDERGPLACDLRGECLAPYQTDFFLIEEGDDHSSAAARQLRQHAGDGEHRGDTGHVVVRAGAARDRIVMSTDDDPLGRFAVRRGNPTDDVRALSV